MNIEYTGSCHCQNVKYKVRMSETLKEAIDCNCSICSRKGHVLTFAALENFTLLSGSDYLKDYQFNTKKIHHLFCTNCGVSSFGKGTASDGTQMYSINVRCLEDVDLSTVKINHYNGKDI